MGPKIQLAALDEVSSLMFEHRVVVGDRDELLVAETFSIRNEREIWIALLAVFPNNERFI